MKNFGKSKPISILCVKKNILELKKKLFLVILTNHLTIPSTHFFCSIQLKKVASTQDGGHLHWCAKIAF